MFNGFGDKVWAGILAGIGFWGGSIEKRMSSRVTHRECDAISKGLKDDVKWIQTAVWDIMKHQNIKPSIEPPEDVVNNSKSK